MSHNQSYSPPTVYQQGAYPPMSSSNSSGPLSGYPALSTSDSGSFAGWMGGPPAAAQPTPAPAPQPVPTIYGNYPSPYSQQQQQPAAHQPYPQQQQPTAQPYPQQQPSMQQPYPQQQQPYPYPQQQPTMQQPYQQQPQPQQPYPYPYQQQQQQVQQPYPSPYPQQQQQPSARYGQNTMQQNFSYGAGGPPAAAVQAAPHLPPPGPAGRKKALLVGCCYPGTSQALNGCINDVQCIQYCLSSRFGFNHPGSIVVLRDDQSHPDYHSSRANILRGIQWLMQDQRPGDSLFFHFSGHGSQQTDYSGDELDGQDETILPTDFKSAGMISDDELNELLVRPLQPGVVLHALIDACHSGTALDLPYRAKYKEGRFGWKLKTRVIKGTSGGTAFQIGACKDSQVAADTNAMSGSAYTGAATFSFIDAIERYGVQQTYANLLQHMMETLRKQQGGAGGVTSALGNGLAGGLTGVAVGLMASFLLGSGAVGGQIPVICCDKQVDLYTTRLAI